jgi:CheY-like chemotaxis protein/predicted transcriptional regulator
MLRILKTLNDNGPGLNKTSLSGKTGLNYATCVQYLEFLIMLGWITIIEKHGARVSLTDTGRVYLLLLLKSSSGQPADQEEIVQSGYDVSSVSSYDLMMKTQSRSFTNSDLIGAIGEYLENQELSAGNILLIEDEPDLVITYKVSLAEFSYNVVAYTDPIRALREFKQDIDRYDVIVSDIRMDSMNGLQLYKEMKSLKPQVKIIFISALDAAPELISVLPGFRKDDFLAKPVDSNTLASKVKTAIQESRLSMSRIKT